MLGKNKSQGAASVTPTIFQGKQGSYPSDQTGKTNTIPNQAEGTGSTTGTSLTPEELKQKLPINTPDFTLDYSPRMEKYVVTLKTDNGQAAYTQWLLQNQSFAPLLPVEQVIIAHQTVAEFHAALDYAEKNKLTPEQEFKKNTDTLLSIVNTLFSPISVPEGTTVMPTVVPSVVPTEIPIPTTLVPIILVPTPFLSPTITSTVPSNLLPNPLTPISSQALNFKQSIAPCFINRSVYDAAASQTGVSWEILAAIHYNEGTCGTNKSLVSGRTIGTNEPDIVRGGGCSSKISGPGIPVPLPAGGCGFYSLLDSAIYAGNHIKGKIGKIPANFQELAKAFSRYNGGGNSNCGSTPYPYCPELFEGEDDAYVVNMLDNKHETMYLVYCADLTKCNPPRIYSRPGAATIIRLITNQI